jgi:hypothetical protein
MSNDAEERVPGLPAALGRPAKPAKDRWHEYAKRSVQAELAGAGIGYKRLAQLLKEDDPASDETADSLARRINRGTFPLAFAFRIYAVLGVRNLDLSRLQTDAHARLTAAKKKR